MKRTLLIISMFVAAIPQRAFCAQPEIAISFSGHTITATGISPGSTAVFFGVAHVPIPGAYMHRVVRWALTADDVTHNGVATIDIGQDVPRVSVWAAVDLRDARYATASGPNVGIRAVPLTNPLKRSKSSDVDSFAFNHAYMNLLYVHPGLGAWSWTAEGGKPPNESVYVGTTQVSLATATPVGTPHHTPDKIVPGGVFIAVDSTYLQIAIVPVTEALVGGAE